MVMVIIQLLLRGGSTQGLGYRVEGSGLRNFNSATIFGGPEGLSKYMHNRCRTDHIYTYIYIYVYGYSVFKSPGFFRLPRPTTCLRNHANGIHAQTIITSVF